MSLYKRVRIWWARMTQDWTAVVCPDCALTHLVEGQWADRFCARCSVLRSTEAMQQTGRPLW
jgi:hypothetical protein